MMWKGCFIFLTVLISAVQNVYAFHQTESKEIWDVRPPHMSASKEGKSIAFVIRNIKTFEKFKGNFPF